jgi:Arc/MetJ-type ribon-helix-helix transcriptional regulator
MQSIMATKTVGFAIEESDSARLERLVEKYGGGNRSAFLRVAIDYLEAAERAERLRKLQAYGAARSAEKDLSPADVAKVVRRVLRSRRRA